MNLQDNIKDFKSLASTSSATQALLILQAFCRFHSLSKPVKNCIFGTKNRPKPISPFKAKPAFVQGETRYTTWGEFVERYSTMIHKYKLLGGIEGIAL